MTIRPIFAWYDLWMGAYWDRKARRLYILPLPTLGVVIDFEAWRGWLFGCQTRRWDLRIFTYRPYRWRPRFYSYIGGFGRKNLVFEWPNGRFTWTCGELVKPSRSPADAQP